MDSVQVLPVEVGNLHGMQAHYVSTQESQHTMPPPMNRHGSTQSEDDKDHDATDENITVVTHHVPPPPTDLRSQLQRQLEYYFSSENLVQDTYLMSQMDGQQYVPIVLIANFNAVKKLTTDIKLITDVLEASTLVQVDENKEKVRPISNGRYVLILREIADNTPVEEIEGLFHDPDCPQFTGVEFAASTCWYVSFNSEADAQGAYRHLREKVKTFKGKPIMARIKLKHHIGSQSSHHGSTSYNGTTTAQQTTSVSSVGSQSSTSAQVDYINMPTTLTNSVFLPSTPQDQYSHMPSMPQTQQPPFIAAIAVPQPVSVPQQITSPSTIMVSQSNGWPTNIYHTDQLISNGYSTAPYFISATGQHRPHVYVQNNGSVHQNPIKNQVYNISNDMQQTRNEMNGDTGNLHMEMQTQAPQYLPAVPVAMKNAFVQPIQHNLYHRQAYMFKHRDMNSDYYSQNMRQNNDSPRYQNKRSSDGGPPQRYSNTRGHHYNGNRLQENGKYYPGGSGSYVLSDVNNNNNSSSRRYNEPSKPTLGDTARFSSVTPKQRKGRRPENVRQQNQQQQQQISQQQQQSAPQPRAIDANNNTPLSPSSEQNSSSFTLENNSFPPLPTNTVNNTTVVTNNPVQTMNGESSQNEAQFRTQDYQNGYDIPPPTNQIPSSTFMLHPEPIIQHGDSYVIYDYPTQATPPVVMPVTTVSYSAQTIATTSENERLTFVNEDNIAEHDNSNSSSICVNNNRNNSSGGNSETGSDCDSDKKPTYAEMLRKINQVKLAKQQQGSDCGSLSGSDEKENMESKQNHSDSSHVDGSLSDDNDSEKQWKQVNSSKRNNSHKMDENQNLSHEPNNTNNVANRGRGRSFPRGRGRGGRFGRNRWSANGSKFQQHNDFDNKTNVISPTSNLNERR